MNLQETIDNQLIVYAMPVICLKILVVTSQMWTHASFLTELNILTFSLCR